ncbi:MAG TPA: deoxyribose-phosphate aldolase [Bacteroidales bacterium]|jgi:deoxyribose-phosphate aldolase|nr:deoxyribose-phosphate aldolase [Bacteroidales bacterium]
MEEKMNQDASNDKTKKEESAKDTLKNMAISQAELASYIDHTLLKPESTREQFVRLCEEAVTYRFKSVCVNSFWVPFVTGILKGSGIKICSVIGFPLGAMDSASKAFETKNAIASGAEEIDMVINVGALKSQDLATVEKDIQAVRQACQGGALLKVIIETVFLDEKEKIQACEISKQCGADFVKTSTGFMGGGATVEDIALMRKVVGPDLGVKASGGIRNFEQAVSLIHAGANRLGCGSSVAVITGAPVKGNY